MTIMVLHLGCPANIKAKKIAFQPPSLPQSGGDPNCHSWGGGSDRAPPSQGTNVKVLRPYWQSHVTPHSPATTIWPETIFIDGRDTHVDVSHIISGQTKEVVTLHHGRQ